MTWSTAPVNSPHGMALDTRTHHIFSAGLGKLAVIDTRTGKMVQTINIAPGSVDQIGLDAVKRRIYCAHGSGSISVVGVTRAGATLLGIVPSHRGAHTLAVDQATHAVWISYSDRTGSYLQEYVAR